LADRLFCCLDFGEVLLNALEFTVDGMVLRVAAFDSQ
jgi:hypothetical protein